MLAALRRRLTIICMAISGIILLGMALFALAITRQQWEKRSAADFERSADAVKLQLLTAPIVKTGWLSQYEMSNRLIIYIEDHGQPLLWRGAWQSATDRSDLLAYTKKAAATQGLDTAVRPTIYWASELNEQKLLFPLQGDANDRYRACVYQLVQGERWLTLIALQDTAEQDAQMRRITWWFLGGAAAGMVLLGVFSWWFAGLAITPVEQAQRRQNRFIADASHELRSPLSVIRLCMQALEQAEGSEAAAFRQTVCLEACHMSRLVEDLLLLAHADAGQWELNCAPVELPIIITEAIKRVSMLAAEKHLTIQQRMSPESPPLVLGDEGYLGQVLRILMQNALEHTPTDGHITVSIYTFSRAVRLRIANTGTCIPEEDLPHLFERFYRANKSRTRDGHYGLGLSIAYEIIHAHQGQIRACNLACGGCAFEVDLPMAKS